MRNVRTSAAVAALLGLAAPAVGTAEAQIRARDGAIPGVGAAILGGVILGQQAQAGPRQGGQQPTRSPAQPSRPTTDEASSQRTLAIQQALADRGYDVPLDGQYGPATRSAISAYQRASGLPVAGRLTAQQAEVLLASPSPDRPAPAAMAPVAAGAAAGTAAPAFASPGLPAMPAQTIPASTAAPAPGPRALPVSVDAPEWASGTWTGTFPCRRRTYSITLKVPVEGSGEPVVLDYRWTAPGAGAGVGRVLLEANASNRRINAIRAESGEPDHPFGQLRLLPDPDQNPTFSSAPCRSTLPLVRDPRTAPARSVPALAGPTGLAVPPASPQSLPAPSPPAPREAGGPSYFGRWQGELSCARNQRQQIEVTFGRVADIAGPPVSRGRPDRRDSALLNADRPGRIAAQVEAFAMRGHTASVAWARFIGEGESDGGVRFASVSNSGQLGELRIRELRIAPNADGRATLDLALNVADATCQQVTLRREDPQGAPQRPAVRVPQGGGTFYQARDLAGRCQALIDWGSRLTSEMASEVANYRPVDPGVLFADPEFVPVFGRPFDLAGETTLRKDALDAMRECQRDPLVRPRLQGWDRVARGPLSDSSWSQEDVYAAYSVRKSRAALNALATAQSASAANPDPVAGIIDLAKAKEVFRAADVALIPSRRQEIVSQIEDGLSARAAQILDREIDRQRGKPPAEVIAYASDARTLSSAVALNVKGAQRERITARLLDIEAQAAGAFMAPNLAALTAAPPTLAGLRQIDALPVAATLPVLSPGVRADHEKRWAADRTAKMEQALARELAAALALPPGRTGLVSGADWHAAFTEAWRDYLKEAPVQAALARYFADRKARLLAATDEFRATVAGRPPAERQQAIAGFLVLPQDRKSPAALEYDLIAFGL
jgi:peptidoglycan hydrolase-like protein with peptidoglycan-binding domain